MKPFSKTRHIVLLFFIFVAIRAIYYSSSDGFSIERIQNSFVREGNALLPPSETQMQQLHAITEQPFIYLSKGSQAYAFQSIDGQYVLKLFKCYHLKRIPWLEKLPLFGPFDRYRHEQLDRRYKKAHATLNSYKIANNTIREECGLVYIQIIPSEEYALPINITDKIGRNYTINLANYGFAIQKKATLVFPLLNRWIKNGELTKAKHFLHSLIELIVQRSLKGVQDQDPDLHKNAGIIGTQALFIDMGGFHLNDNVHQPTVYINDIRKITKRLYSWLKKHSVELSDYLDQEIARLDQPEPNEVKS